MLSKQLFVKNVGGLMVKILHITLGFAACFKYRSALMQLVIGDYPEACVQPTRAFKNTGVHFAGPLTIKSSLRRNAPLNKAYTNL